MQNTNLDQENKACACGLAPYFNGDGVMIVRETQAKAILSVSKVYDYALDPYNRWEHNCSYCYARFMNQAHQKVEGHRPLGGNLQRSKQSGQPELSAA
jgi:hypothetical protein